MSLHFSAVFVLGVLLLFPMVSAKTIILEKNLGTRNITGDFSASGDIFINGSRVCTSGNNACVNMTVNNSIYSQNGWRNDSGGGNVSLMNFNVNVSMGALFINNANNRVGINNNSPNYAFTVNNGNVSITGSGAGVADVNTGMLLFGNAFDSSGTSPANKIILYDAGTTRYGIGLSSNSFNFHTGTSAGFQWFTSATGTSAGINYLNLSNAGILSSHYVSTRRLLLEGTGNFTQDVVTNSTPLSQFSVINKGYVESRGENLVTNGFGYLQNDYNFETFNFNSQEVFAGKGSFETYGLSSSALSREQLPVDPTKRYRLEGWAKAGNTDGTNYSATNRQYYGISTNDIDGNNIAPYHFQKYSTSARTRLARPIQEGDTSIWLQNATNWNNGSITANHSRNLLWYRYSNSFGYIYPDYTYSRNTSVILDCLHGTNVSGTHGLWQVGGVDSTTGELRLNGAWNSGACGNISNNTAVINTLSGGTYKYIAASNVIVPNNWTKYTGYIGGIDENLTASQNMFPPGTAFVQLLFLYNYPGTSAGSVIRWSALSFTEAVSDNLEKASATQIGTVSLDNQQLGDGDKYFGGKVGVLTTTPSAHLHVVGDNASLVGMAYTAPVANTQNVFLLEGSTGADMLYVNNAGRLYLNSTMGIGTAPDTNAMLTIAKTATEAGTIGIYSATTYANISYTGDSARIYSTANHNTGTQAANVAARIIGWTGSTNASATTTTNYAILAQARRNNHASIGTNIAVYGGALIDADTNGTITNNIGVEAVNSLGANTAVTNAYNFFGVWSLGANATITNAYGYYNPVIYANGTAYSYYAESPTAPTKYNLYMNGDAPNYLGGNTTINGTLIVKNMVNLTQELILGINITMFSPNGTRFNCGVNDTGGFLCS